MDRVAGGRNVLVHGVLREDTYLELKVKLSNSDKIAKGIVALANTDGGTMIFGVSDQLRIEGVRDAENVQKELARISKPITR